MSWRCTGAGSRRARRPQRPRRARRRGPCRRRTTRTSGCAPMPAARPPRGRRGAPPLGPAPRTWRNARPHRRDGRAGDLEGRDVVASRCRARDRHRPGKESERASPHPPSARRDRGRAGHASARRLAEIDVQLAPSERNNPSAPPPATPRPSAAARAPSCPRARPSIDTSRQRHRRTPDLRCAFEAADAGLGLDPRLPREPSIPIAVHAEATSSSRPPRRAPRTHRSMTSQRRSPPAVPAYSAVTRARRAPSTRPRLGALGDRDRPGAAAAARSSRALQRRRRRPPDWRRRRATGARARVARDDKPSASWWPLLCRVRVASRPHCCSGRVLGSLVGPRRIAVARRATLGAGPTQAQRFPFRPAARRRSSSLPRSAPRSSAPCPASRLRPRRPRSTPIARWPEAAAAVPANRSPSGRHAAAPAPFARARPLPIQKAEREASALAAAREHAPRRAAASRPVDVEFQPARGGAPPAREAHGRARRALRRAPVGLVARAVAAFEAGAARSPDRAARRRRCRGASAPLRDARRSRRPRRALPRARARHDRRAPGPRKPHPPRRLRGRPRRGRRGDGAPRDLRCSAPRPTRSRSLYASARRSTSRTTGTACAASPASRPCSPRPCRPD